MAALLGVDGGTTSVKAVVFDLEGHPLGLTAEEYPLVTPGPVQVELDCETQGMACC